MVLGQAEVLNLTLCSQPQPDMQPRQNPRTVQASLETPTSEQGCAPGLQSRLGEHWRIKRTNVVKCWRPGAPLELRGQKEPPGSQGAEEVPGGGCK